MGPSYAKLAPLCRRTQLSAPADEGLLQRGEVAGCPRVTREEKEKEAEGVAPALHGLPRESNPAATGPEGPAGLALLGPRSQPRLRLSCEAATSLVPFNSLNTLSAPIPLPPRLSPQLCTPCTAHFSSHVASSEKPSQILQPVSFVPPCLFPLLNTSQPQFSDYMDLPPSSDCQRHKVRTVCFVPVMSPKIVQSR